MLQFRIQWTIRSIVDTTTVPGQLFPAIDFLSFSPQNAFIVAVKEEEEAADVVFKKRALQTDEAAFFEKSTAIKVLP